MKTDGKRLAAGSVAISLTLLAACGQKGPLYLPDKGSVITRPAGSSAPGTPPTQGQQTTVPPQSSSPAPSDQAEPNSSGTPPPPRKPEDRKDDDGTQAQPHR